MSKISKNKSTIKLPVPTDIHKIWCDYTSSLNVMNFALIMSRKPPYKCAEIYQEYLKQTKILITNFWEQCESIYPEITSTKLVTYVPEEHQLVYDK